MKLLKKLFFFFSIILSIFIIREFISIYNDLMGISKYLGYSFILFAVFILLYFVLIPLGKIFAMPKSFAPTKNRDEIAPIIEKRLKQFKKNKYITDKNIEFSLTPEENHAKAIAVLEEETHKIRRGYVSKVFYGTAISQNGFLDAIILLSASVNLVKDIFTVYNGRVSNRDLLIIGRKIYTAIAIAGSESVEYVTDEIITSFATGGMKSIPFIDKIMSSLTAGFVNAMLVTRISYITENYCKLIYIESDKDLFPSLKIVHDTAKTITNDIRTAIKQIIRNISVEKAETFAKYAVNPTRFIFEKALDGKHSRDDTIPDSRFNNMLKSGIASIVFTFEKTIGFFAKK